MRRAAAAFFIPVIPVTVAAITFAQYGDITDLKVAKPEDKQHVTSVPPPKGAKVLFDGTAESLKAHWEKQDGGDAEWEIKDGAMQVKGGSIVTREKINEPVYLHLEFRTPYEPGDKGQGRGNSGVYLQGRYEVQVLDSYGIPIDKYEMGDCGCIYGVAIARKNACKPPTVWQSYDIIFAPPKFEGDKKVAAARMTVIHNGVKIHDNQEITTDNTTAGMGGDPKTPGPIMLQDHGDPVQYRNVWVVPARDIKIRSE
ncbi:MAG TPA: DUF1080 domain-containing protein [Tepidisphaeraceae bacterium]|nr:DUF1080 domain-containing protein [Tepidisphaeraceae bacterium]